MFKDEDQIKQPIIFTDNPVEEAIGFIENEINGDSNFAITKTTQNGKWMRHGLLFFSMNGVEVYTDPNNIIFVDMINKTMFIREHEKVNKNISTDNPEEKQYIILYTDLGYNEDSEEEFPLRWESVQGRTNVYENIKANAPVIDLDKSIVLVESVPVKDALTVREFVKYLQNSDMVDKYDGFDIDEFTGSEYI